VTDDLGRPDFATLLDWVEGRLDDDAAARVAAQLADADERTRRTADWLRGFVATARSMPLHEPPPIVRQSLSQHFARWRRARAELESQPREVPVRLLFDSRQDLAPAGVRAGADNDDAIHLAYSADDGDLLLDIYDLGNGQVRIDGQALPADPQGAPVFEARLTGAGVEVRTRDGDELGRFSLPAAPQARCRLAASNGVLTFVADVDTGPGGERR
jgi:hypothetical protein